MELGQILVKYHGPEARLVEKSYEHSLKVDVEAVEPVVLVLTDKVNEWKSMAVL